MIIYEPADFVLNQNELHLLAFETAKRMLPGAKILSSSLNTQRISFFLRNPSRLVAFEFYLGELQERDGELLLKDMNQLKTKDEKLTDSPINQIDLYIVAHEFPKCFLLQTHTREIQIQLFKWMLIHSGNYRALLIQKFDREEEQKELSKSDHLGIKSTDAMPYHSDSCKELTTAELIELTRLSMEIRARR